MTLATQDHLATEALAQALEQTDEFAARVRATWTLDHISFTDGFREGMRYGIEKAIEAWRETRETPALTHPKRAKVPRSRRTKCK